MAIKIEVGEARRGDLWFVKPSNILVDWTKNGRDEPPSDAESRVLAKDIRDNGQLQPVLGRRLPDRRVELVFGFRRYAAALLIEREDPEFRLKIVVEDMNEKQAFLRNVRENLHRKDVTPIDSAHNIERLERYGVSPQEIADVFGISTTQVASFRKLLVLPDQIQKRVANGTLGFSVALELSKLTESEAIATLAGIDAESGGAPSKVKGPQVKEALRRRGAKIGRGVSDLRRALDGRDDPVSLAILEFLAGTVDDEGLGAAIDQNTKVSHAQLVAS